MLIYVISAIYASIFGYIYQKSRLLPYSKRFKNLVPGLSIIASCAILVVLSGTRVGVGIDYWAYTDIFSGIRRGEEFFVESGFLFLNQVIGYFTDNPQWLFFISSAVTLILLYRFIVKYSVNIAYSIFLYFGLCLIFFSFNTTRQFIAISISLLAFGALIERRFVRYLIVVLLAATVHTTAIVLLPLYFLLNIRLTKFRVLIMLAVALGIYLVRNLVLDMFFWLYPQHQGSEFLLNRIEFSEIMIVTAIILLLMVRHLLVHKRITYLGMNKVYINIIFFILFTHVVFAWVPGITRILLFLDALLLVIIPYIISKFPKGQRDLILIISVVYFSFYAFISTSINDSHGVIPYESSLMKSNLRGQAE